METVEHKLWGGHGMRSIFAILVIAGALVASCWGGSKPDNSGDILAEGGGPACQRYLSCLSAVDPESYVAALALYGDESQCASESANAGCERACTAAFEHYEHACNCSGSNCVSCVPEIEGRIYKFPMGANQPTFACVNAEGPAPWLEPMLEQVTVKSLDNAGNVVLDVRTNRRELLLSGTINCDGPWVLTGQMIDSDCNFNSGPVTVEAEVYVPADGQLALNLSFTVVCEADPPLTRTCTSSAVGTE